MNTDNHTQRRGICTVCGHVHGLHASTKVIGRFRAAGPIGYIARGIDSAQIRGTREEALADKCADLLAGSAVDKRQAGELPAIGALAWN